MAKFRTGDAPALDKHPPQANGPVMHDFATSFYRKSDPDDMRNSPRDPNVGIGMLPIVDVSDSMYDHITSGADLSPEVIRQIRGGGDEAEARGYGYGKWGDIFGAVVRAQDGRMMVVDLQGYNYARYQGPVYQQGRVMPF